MNTFKTNSYFPQGFFGFFPRNSAFEPVGVVAGYQSMDNPTRHHAKSALGEVLPRQSEPPFRNWMIDSDDSGRDKSHSSTDSSDGPMSLPSPSNLPFYPRKWRDSKKERRARTTFTSPQTQVLEVEYRRSEYISRPRRYELATQLNLKEVQIKIWYQNRRAKDKRIEKATWDRQYRCFGLAATGAVSANQFPAPTNYRLTTSGLNAPHQHPLHMFPSSTTSFPPHPLLEHFQQEINRQLGSVTIDDKTPVHISGTKKNLER